MCTGDVASNWKIFTEAFADYSTATKLTKKAAEVQAATLKTVMGKDCRQILSRLELTEEEKKDTAAILTKLKAYFGTFYTNDIFFTPRNSNRIKTSINI